ncbi:acetylcholine receptor subunit beta-like [Amblyomma americanum]
MNWKDDRLEGSKEEFQGVPHVSLDLSEVWWPRVDVVTAGQEDSEFLPRFALLTPEAGLWMCYTTKVRSPCSVDTRDFPNDEQVRTRLQHSAHVQRLQRQRGEVGRRLCVGNLPAKCQHTDLDRSFVEIFFHLRRFGLRHRYTPIVPCVASALVMLATFWVPPASDQRLIVTCLNVLFVALMLHRTAATIGSSITTSNILLFLGLATIVQAVAAIGNVAVLNGLAFGRRIEVPYILRRFLSGTAGTVLCLIEPQQPRTSAQQPADEEPQLSTFNNVPKNNEHWLLSMQALDRLFFVVFAFMTLGFLV